MTSLSNVFKAYDIRGVVPDELNAEQFRAIGMAVARDVSQRDVDRRWVGWLREYLGSTGASTEATK